MLDTFRTSTGCSVKAKSSSKKVNRDHFQVSYLPKNIRECNAIIKIVSEILLIYYVVASDLKKRNSTMRHGELWLAEKDRLQAFASVYLSRTFIELEMTDLSAICAAVLL